MGPRFRGDDVIADLLRYSYRREGVDVGDDIDDDRPVGLERLLERGADLGGLLDADAERADVFGDPGEVLPGVGPELLAALGLLAAVDAVEAALRLVAARVVVDERDGVQLPAHRGLELADVVPEARVAGESDHRAVGARGLGAEAGGEGPAEVAGASHVALLHRAQVVHAAHP